MPQMIRFPIVFGLGPTWMACKLTTTACYSLAAPTQSSTQQALKNFFHTSCMCLTCRGEDFSRTLFVTTEALLLQKIWCKILLLTCGEYISNNILFIKIHCFITYADTFYADILILIKSLTGRFMKSKAYWTSSLATSREKEKQRVEQKTRLLWSDSKHFETDPFCNNNQMGFFLLLCRTVIQMQALKQASLFPVADMPLCSVYYS